MPARRYLYITYSPQDDCRHKIWGLVKGEEESGFHFTPRCFHLVAFQQAATTKCKAEVVPAPGLAAGDLVKPVPSSDASPIFHRSQETFL